MSVCGLFNDVVNMFTIQAGNWNSLRMLTWKSVLSQHLRVATDKKTIEVLTIVFLLVKVLPEFHPHINLQRYR
jgi:hypothetical protein